jgi:hypothetical protein
MMSLFVLAETTTIYYLLFLQEQLKDHHHQACSKSFDNHMSCYSNTNTLESRSAFHKWPHTQALCLWFIIIS